jgi:hypothetical protein
MGNAAIAITNKVKALGLIKCPDVGTANGWAIE